MVLADRARCARARGHSHPDSSGALRANRREAGCVLRGRRGVERALHRRRGGLAAAGLFHRPAGVSVRTICVTPLAFGVETVAQRRSSDVLLRGGIRWHARRDDRQQVRVTVKAFLPCLFRRRRTAQRSFALPTLSNQSGVPVKIMCTSKSIQALRRHIHASQFMSLFSRSHACAHVARHRQRLSLIPVLHFRQAARRERTGLLFPVRVVRKVGDVAVAQRTRRALAPAAFVDGAPVAAWAWLGCRSGLTAALLRGRQRRAHQMQWCCSAIVFFHCVRRILYLFFELCYVMLCLIE